MHLHRSSVAALLALHLLTASAQDDFLIPCAGSPAESVLQLPPPLNDWGKVYCTKFGHTLAARDRWIWSFPSALAPVHLPAQMVRDQPKEVGNAAHFKKIELLALNGQDAQDVVAKINGKLGTRSNPPVSSAYRLTLVNQEGDTHEVLFAITKAEVELGKGHWGMWCDKNCADGSPFMLLNYEKQAK
jgi:hypothetical protein